MNKLIEPFSVSVAEAKAIREKYGNGPYGPDWTSNELDLLMPLAKRVSDIRWAKQWLNFGEAPFGIARLREISEGGYLEAMQAVLDLGSREESEYWATRSALRPCRHKPDGSPYNSKTPWCSTHPSNDPSVEALQPKEEGSFEDRFTACLKEIGLAAVTIAEMEAGE